MCSLNFRLSAQLQKTFRCYHLQIYDEDSEEIRSSCPSPLFMFTYCRLNALFTDLINRGYSRLLFGTHLSSSVRNNYLLYALLYAVTCSLSTGDMNVTSSSKNTYYSLPIWTALYLTATTNYKQTF
jgi:hypothetical protein